ncbi:MAG: nucleotidyl transferase AbiEii/AbiGii toxin family protein [Opitutales bacterium]|nr:nucleotidyl transferase AbiEii/AbiGii toxin family protein [Opitutales bacterium]MCH8539801.1 nucleotidyl transferase AbiEii/AbiGii toxin family protein [Opitutales bacterium]
MITPRCFQEAWIREQADALKARDLRTLEKNILALELASRLQRGGLEFIFKGGTSLALLFDPVQRLSIDVDILSLEPIDQLKAVLEKWIVDQPPFTAYEHQVRRDREAPPTVHFRIFYRSALDPSGLHSIQLDVVTAESPYAATEERTVKAPFFEIEEEIRITIPTADCLLADKLACFAPATIGYPYQPIIARTGVPGDPRPMKVVKHLFDVGELSSHAVNRKNAVKTYRAIHAEQLRWRGGQWTIDETLNDTQEAAFWVCRRDLRPKENHQRIDFFSDGIRAMDSHLFNQPFQRAESRLASARAALVAEWIRQEAKDFDLSAFLKTECDLETIRDATLEGSWTNLNRLKQTDPKAFECWLQAQHLRLNPE